MCEPSKALVRLHKCRKTSSTLGNGCAGATKRSSETHNLYRPPAGYTRCTSVGSNAQTNGNEKSHCVHLWQHCETCERRVNIVFERLACRFRTATICLVSGGCCCDPPLHRIRERVRVASTTSDITALGWIIIATLRLLASRAATFDGGIGCFAFLAIVAGDITRLLYGAAISFEVCCCCRGSGARDAVGSSRARRTCHHQRHTAICAGIGVTTLRIAAGAIRAFSGSFISRVLPTCSAGVRRACRLGGTAISVIGRRSRNHYVFSLIMKTVSTATIRGLECVANARHRFTTTSSARAGGRCAR